MTYRAILATSAALVAYSVLAADVPDDATLADDQTFSYHEPDQPASFDPQLVEGVPGAHMVQQLFETLMIQDEKGNLVPGVATGYEANGDSTEFTFTLREDARWSNGDPVTAGDFVYAWRRVADPATASQYAWFVELAGLRNASEIIAGEAEPDTLGVEALDDRTLKVSLVAPKPYFPKMVAHTTLAPVHQATVEEYGDARTDPANIVSNGAYVLDNLELNEYWSAGKIPEYWDADNVVIEEVLSYIINGTSQALTRWEAGEFDLLEPVPAGSFPRLEEQYPDAAHSEPRLRTYYYEMNQRETAPEALKNPDIRPALALASTAT